MADSKKSVFSSYAEFERRLGIVRRKHWLLWGDDGVMAWLPRPVKAWIVHAWNFVSCRLMGHEDFGLGECVNCLKPLPKDPRMTEWIESQRPR